MNLSLKLLALLGVPLISFWVIGYFESQNSQQSLSKSIKQTSSTKAKAVIDEIDRNFHSTIKEWTTFAKAEDVQWALRKSNQEFAAMQDVNSFIDSQDKKWRAASEEKTTQFMDSLLHNNLSKQMRARLDIYEQWKGYPVFGEVFLTNRYGANIAQTGRTSDYKQDDEKWWRETVKKGVHITEVEYDKSAGIQSVNICLRIEDENGKLLGILKSVMDILNVIKIVDARSDDHTFDILPEMILFDNNKQIICAKNSNVTSSSKGEEYFQDVTFKSKEQIISVKKINQSTGKEVLATYAFSQGDIACPATGWCLLVEYNTEDIFAPIVENRNLFISLLSGISAFIILIGGPLVFSICHRIKKLRNATNAISNGQLQTRVSVNTKDEVGELSRSFNQMADDIQSANKRLQHAVQEAKQADQAKSDFLANMSHEIRTPLTAILGFSDMILEKLDDPQSIDAAETIKRNSDHLLKIINDILDISKIESGKFKVEKIKCSPLKMIGYVSGLMQTRCAEKNIKLIVDYESLVPEMIYTDQTRLQQVLINLLDNAIKFTDEGSVTFKIKYLQNENKNLLCFEVIDTGIGIEKNKLDTIFEPFTQADTSDTRIYGGTGLGLAITTRLVKFLDGTIEAESEPGKGSTFRISIDIGKLKIVKLIAPIAERKPVSKEKNQNIDTPLMCSVLLVEDGVDNQRIISHILKKSGAIVTIAENGAVGIEKVKTEAEKGNYFDIILMDIQMPILDGFSATKQLRESGYEGTIIALTANAMTTDREKCLACGCDDYLTKPLNIKLFLSTIKSYLKSTNEEELLRSIV